jgi:allantoate deiminase
VTSRFGSAPLIPQDLIAHYIRELGKCGEQPNGGIIRPQYSQSWVEARGLIAEWMHEAGLDIRYDSVGNLYGRLVGVDDRRTILTGSHIDTVQLGGKYDGALGVLCGLAALETLRKNVGQPQRSLEVVALCEEEGSRFHANYFGTRAILGLIDRQEFAHLLDQDGVSLAEAMISVGLSPERFQESIRDDIDAFIELHIEQGPILYESGIDIGVVTGITGLCWLNVIVSGRADHAGTTPMDSRLDALQCAVNLVLAISDVAKRRGRPAVATVGMMKVEPGGANIVPGLVSFSVDMRHPDDAELMKMIEEVRKCCQEIASDASIDVSVELVKNEESAPTDERLQQVIIGAAQACNVSWTSISSGAGHDSQLMAKHIPSAMIFVPSVDGRSHSAMEYTLDRACAIGAHVLATSLYALAYDQ